MTTSLIVAEETWYLPTYLIDDRPPDATGTCSLFTRRYELRLTPAGVEKLSVYLDVEEYVDETAMVAAIEERGLTELPSEADGNPMFVPEALRTPGLVIERGDSRTRRRARIGAPE